LLAAGLRRAVIACSRGRFAIILPLQRVGKKLGAIMKNPLDSISGTIVSGIILTVVLYFFLKNFILAGV
jgi:hypothetical protein